MTVNVWYPIENIKPPGFGYLIPRSVSPEQNPEHALGVVFDSDIGVGAANEPKGTKLFVLMGGHYYDNKTPPTEEEAVAQAKAVLERHLGIPRETPCFAMARLARDCIPQLYVGHRELMATADRQLNEAFGGLLTVAGGSFSRPGAVAGIRAGYDAAMQIAAGKPSTGLEVFREVKPEFVGVARHEIRVRHFAKPG
jgi:oxygen-dependent protoporphyrinogen oxidase